MVVIMSFWFELRRLMFFLMSLHTGKLKNEHDIGTHMTLLSTSVTTANSPRRHFLDI